MLQFTIYGNLGGDAQVKNENGRKFVSFNVAHTERWQDANGQQQERTQWVSCALSGDGGGLLPFLTKGRTVFVQGRGSARIYSSPKEKRMVAGLNISVDRVELIGGSSDVVPRHLYMHDGAQVDTYKAYFVPLEVAKACGASKKNLGSLYDHSGHLFQVDVNGFISPLQQQEQPQESSEQPTK